AIARGARFGGSGSFRQPKATEETLHLRVRRERQIALKAHHLGATGGLDADRYDGGLHLFDDVGKTHRGLDALGISDRSQSRACSRREKSRAQQQRDAEAGGASKPKETTARGEGRFPSGNARSHKCHSIVGAASAGGHPLQSKMGDASLPRAVEEIKLW